MPNIKQQKKRMRLAIKQRDRNRQVKSTLKTLFKKLDATVSASDREAAATVANELTKSIDKAAAGGVIHKNNAARKKSRVARTLARVS